MHHEEYQMFGTSNIIDIFRALLGSIVRDFRNIEEKKGKQHSEEVPLELISKFNSVFEYYFTGKMPDELKFMTSDQKEILKPLLSTVWEYCLSKLDLFQESCQGYEEIIVCEVYLLLANSILFKYQVGKDRVNKQDSDKQALSVTRMIESKLLLSLETDDRNWSMKFMRYCIIFILKACFLNTGRQVVFRRTPCIHSWACASLCGSPVSSVWSVGKRHLAELIHHLADEKVRSGLETGHGFC